MNLSNRTLITACLLLSLALYRIVSAEFELEKYAPKNGTVHTNFTLPSIQDGSRISLSDFHGKRVLLLHFASW